MKEFTIDDIGLARITVKPKNAAGEEGEPCTVDIDVWLCNNSLVAINKEHPDDVVKRHLAYIQFLMSAGFPELSTYGATKLAKLIMDIAEEIGTEVKKKESTDENPDSPDSTAPPS